MSNRAARSAIAAVALAAGVLVCCGGEEVQPIRINGNLMSVTNLTRSQWTNVEVWMNNHYRVTVPKLEPGQRFDVPLDAFVAGNGHRFQPKNQRPEGIQVLARSAEGTSVTINWGKGRQWY